mmetsp:Transcript_14540/g.39914  ORF Transcript_14540/g.39914 Transcript_14540/m.39914 type:complete len:294 (+) Transcript_14540:397-1278(+)
MMRLPRTTATMFITRPTLRKSAIWMRLVPNTIAFGGVATGNMKAKEHAQVAGISILIGCVSVDRATVESMGNTVFAVAVFDAISVNPQMLKTIKKISPKLEKSLKSPNSSPRYAVSEDSLKPFEMAPPAPMRRMTPHSIFCSASAHEITAFPGCLTEGMMKRRMAAAHAIVESFTPVRSAGEVTLSSLITSTRIRYPNTCKNWINATTISSRLMGPSSAYLACKTDLSTLTFTPRMYTKAKTTNAHTTSVALMGIAKANHSEVLILPAITSCWIKTPLGGVPMVVATPPQVAA